MRVEERRVKGRGEERMGRREEKTGGERTERGEGKKEGRWGLQTSWNPE